MGVVKAGRYEEQALLSNGLYSTGSGAVPSALPLLKHILGRESDVSLISMTGDVDVSSIVIVSWSGLRLEVSVLTVQ